MDYVGPYPDLRDVPMCRIRVVGVLNQKENLGEVSTHLIPNLCNVFNESFQSEETENEDNPDNSDLT